MVETTVKCACRSGSKPVGKCYRCEAFVCERCVTFVAGQAVCVYCAKGHEHSIVMEVQMGRTVNLQKGESIVGHDDLVIKRRHQLRKVYRTIHKCTESALFFMAIVSVILSILFFSHIMDFFASFAWQEPNLKNPLARLTLSLAGRTDMLYFRYDAAIGHYMIFEDRYPDNKEVSTAHFRIASCYLLMKEYRAAKYYFEDFVTRWPEHEYRKNVDKQLQIINRIYTAAEAESG